tara:strand:- start:1237 stop:1566 length:330 start_codon:yes stop_codon:yes gene_type:complete
MDLRSLVKEAIDDGLYEASVIMRLDRSENLTIVTDKLRGLCGVTIVNISEPSKPVSETVEKVVLKVRFFLLETSIKAQLMNMSTNARKIKGVYSFIPVQAKKYYSRIYR